MKNELQQAKNWTTKSLPSGHSLKILGVVVVGTLVIGVSGLNNAAILGDEPKSTASESALIPGAPTALAGFTPNQQVEILGEMDDFGVDSVTHVDALTMSESIQERLEVQRVPDIQFSPEIITEVGSGEDPSIPDDAWTFDAPFYENLTEASSVEGVNP
ncbi:MAG: hypothetical protein ACE5Q6_00505 [Dehalococcoidia bacterium]